MGGSATEELARRKQLVIIREMARRNYMEFARYIFKEEYEVPLLESWYHALITLALMKVASGDITRLIINIPPAYGKTEFAVRLFVAWVLGNNPKKRVIYTSYSDALAKKTPGEVKDIIKSPAYRAIFPDVKLGDKRADQEWYLESRGGMYSTTVGGAITGFHGNFILIDDPMKAIEKNSKTARDFVVNFYKGSITSRLRKDDPNSAIIVIMQRLHEDDLVGYLLKNEPGVWTHINLTGIESEERVYEFFEFYYLRPANEPLNPHFEDVQKLEQQKRVMHEDWFSQYMQDPQQIETGYVTDGDFVEVAKWEIAPDQKCISIDPAQSTKETADNRAISVVGCSITEEQIELYNVYGTWYGKWSNDEFVKHIISTMIHYPDASVYMESSGGGILTEQNLKKELAKVNAKRKMRGEAMISNHVELFNPKTSISKNMKIDQSITYLRNHQIRFVIGAPGVGQNKKEYKAFHPEKDSKEDDCMETIANPIVNAWVIPKPPPKKEKGGVSVGRDNVRGVGKRHWPI